MAVVTRLTGIEELGQLIDTLAEALNTCQEDHCGEASGMDAYNLNEGYQIICPECSRKLDALLRHVERLA